MRRQFLVLIAPILLAMLLVGCDESSPTGPGEASYVFSGEVKALEATLDFVTLLDTRTVRVEMVDLQATLIDLNSTESLDLSIGLGLGEPTGDGDCALTFQQIVTEGDFFVFRLTRGDYCLSMADPGTWPSDTVVAFGLAVEIE